MAMGDRDDDAGDRAEDGGRIGPFSSWRALYLTVIVYSIGVILVLYLLTRLLDYRGG